MQSRTSILSRITVDECFERADHSDMALPRKTILCVEDDLETSALIAEEFEERGYEIALAHDGQAGVSAVLKLPPDLVLCDVSLPIMGGFELLDRLTELT